MLIQPSDHVTKAIVLSHQEKQLKHETLRMHSCMPGLIYLVSTHHLRSIASVVHFVVLQNQTF